MILDIHYSNEFIKYEADLYNYIEIYNLIIYFNIIIYVNKYL